MARSVGVSFDGVGDYLYRSSDLSGNSDSSEFTFSCMVYPSARQSALYWSGDSSDDTGCNIRVSIDGVVSILMKDVSESIVVSASSGTGLLPVNTASHLVISIDLSSSSRRHVYVNDRDVTDYFSWSAYSVGAVINFTRSIHRIGCNRVVSGDCMQGRLSHVFLAYRYCDLSAVSNRRVFVTSDYFPAADIRAGWISAGYAAPVICMDMIDTESACVNSGFGGDFIASGLLGDVSVGFNQWQCVSSEFDGSGDYLSLAGPLAMSDSKQCVLSVVVKNNAGSLGYVCRFRDPGGDRYFSVMHHGNYIYVELRDSVDTVVFAYKSRSLGLSSEHHLVIEVDTSSASAVVLLDNVDDSAGVTTLIQGGLIGFSKSGVRNCIGAQYYNAALYDPLAGSVGELYINDAVIGVSVDRNPFWDDVYGRPKPVRQVLSGIGVAPLVAMPLRADDPGKNYGSAGNFTLHGAGLTGARGMSERITRSCYCKLEDYLYRNASVRGVSGSGVFSFFGAFERNGGTGNNSPIIAFSNNTSTDYFSLSLGSDSEFRVWVRQDNNNVITLSDTSRQKAGCNIFFISYDGNTMYIRLNDSITTSNLSGVVVDFSLPCDIFRLKDSSVVANHEIAEEVGVMSLLFSDEYIDFFSEESRHLFVDQLGYPKDLTPAIESGDIPRPVFYLKFDDPDDLGLDYSGNNNHFTLSGVTQGADFYV